MIATSACRPTAVSDLVHAAQQGDGAALSRLYENHEAMLRSVVLRIVRNDADTDDVLQEIFVQVLQSIGELNSPHSFSGWIRTVARRKALDFVKSKGRRRESGDLDGFTTVQHKGPSPPELAMRSENHERLRSAVTALPKPYREVVQWIYLEGRSLRQISEKGGLPIGTVKSRSHEARKQLKHLLERV